MSMKNFITITKKGDKSPSNSNQQNNSNTKQNEKSKVTMKNFFRNVPKNSPPEEKKHPFGGERLNTNETNCNGKQLSQMTVKETASPENIIGLNKGKHSSETNGYTLDSVSPKRPKIERNGISSATNRFIFVGRDYSQQFYNLYLFRLTEMTKLLKKVVLEKWGEELPIKKLCDLREDDPGKCIIIGTLFKHQQLKPSILREISEENQLAPQPPHLNFVSENDKLILEDELQRIRLIGKVDVHTLVTGVVCAVKGYVECDGKFDVEDIIFYESGPQRSLNVIKDSQLLVIISGFDQSSAEKNSQSIQLLQKWLNGKLSNYENAGRFNKSKISRIIFAGNSIRSTPEAKLKSLASKKLDSSAQIVQDVKNFDKWIHESFENVSVDLMPGEHDPSNFMLPQQPFHECMFPLSSSLQNFKSTTNPYELELFDRLILGTSGQNINDILRTSKIEDCLKAAENLIKWGHLVPTSPDTLACYPYVSKDPFIIEECPHVLFAGNMSEFKTVLREGSDSQRTRIVCVPKFCETQSIAVVDLNTLDCEEISFKSR